MDTLNNVHVWDQTFCLLERGVVCIADDARMRNHIAERTAEFAWFSGKTRVYFAARVSGFTATKRTSKPFRKIRETCFDPIEGKFIHMFVCAA